MLLRGHLAELLAGSFRQYEEAYPQLQEAQTILLGLSADNGTLTDKEKENYMRHYWLLAGDCLQMLGREAEATKSDNDLWTRTGTLTLQHEKSAAMRHVVGSLQEWEKQKGLEDGADTVLPAVEVDKIIDFAGGQILHLLQNAAEREAEPFYKRDNGAQAMIVHVARRLLATGLIQDQNKIGYLAAVIRYFQADLEENLAIGQGLRECLDLLPLLESYYKCEGSTVMMVLEIHLFSKCL